MRLSRIKLRLYSSTTNLNPFNIQTLPSTLHSKVFPSHHQSSSLTRLQLQCIDLARQNLSLHRIPFTSPRPALPEVDGDFVPELLADSVDEHFRVMAESVAEPYLRLAQEFASTDWNALVLPSLSDYESFFNSSSNVHQSGWFHFCPEEKRFIGCAEPCEEAAIFDVETAPGVREFPKAPLLACALTRRGLYMWLSPQLSDWKGGKDGKGDSVDVDIADATTSTGTTTQSSNTTTQSSTTTHTTPNHLINLTSPLLLIGHHISFDRARLSSQYSLSRSPMRFLDTLSMHCAVAGISSQQRGLWKEQQKSEAEFDDAEALEDDDEESTTTRQWCKFGSLNNLKDALKLHCGLHLDKSTRSDVLLSATSVSDLLPHLPRIAQYCAEDVRTTGILFSALLPKFLKKSPHPVTFAALLEMSTFIVPIKSLNAWTEYYEKCDALLKEASELLQSKLLSLVDTLIAQHPPGSPDPIDDPWLNQLDWHRKETIRWTKPRFLKDGVTYAKGGAPQPSGNAQLHLKPAWYRKLWRSGREGVKVTPRTGIVPLLLRLRWEGRPVAMIPERGWCYEIGGDGGDSGDGKEKILWNGKFYKKIPHPGGRDDNVGCLLSKSFFKFFESRKLWSPEHGELIEQILGMNAGFSFWSGYRERIREQLVIESEDAEKNAFIVPAVMPMGTVTRRAVEKTWLTAANPKESLVGSELKCLVQAPPGWSLVGADVDSQELWIGALLGDAQFGWSGSTAVGWMALQGSKADGSDLHSRTAQILGMSRDQAKIFNYGRIYGAGVKYAAQLLLRFNPALSAEEATSKAQALYHQTKGKRMAARRDAFVTYAQGTESFMFNQMEAIARQPRACTPVLRAQLSEGLSAEHVESEFLTSRVNWVVQSSGVDYLHLMLVSMAYLMRCFEIPGRVALCIHDELRFLVPREHRLRAALALQISNLWVRAAFVEAVGIRDLPLSVAFFSAVDVDWVLRKEVNMSCRTPSQPEALEPGESYDIYRLLKECPSLGRGQWPGRNRSARAGSDSDRREQFNQVSQSQGKRQIDEAEYLALLKKQIYGKVDVREGRDGAINPSSASNPNGTIKTSTSNPDPNPSSYSNTIDSSNQQSNPNSHSPSTPMPNVQEHFKKWKELIKNRPRPPK